MVGNGPGHILEQTRIETTTPDETFQKVFRFFQSYAATGRIQAIGVGSFGPLDLNPDSQTFGFITSTPKPGWRNTDVAGRLRQGLGIKVIIDTDVNAAALGEFRWGASQGFDPSLYVTVGTGIGGGYVKDGQPLTGMLKPETGPS